VSMLWLRYTDETGRVFFEVFRDCSED